MNNARHRLRPNPTNSVRKNHRHRQRNFHIVFELLRKEVTETLGLPSDCRIYFLKKHDINNLPNKDHLKILHGNCVLLDADTWKVLQAIRMTGFCAMDDEKIAETKFVVKSIYDHTMSRGTVEVNAAMKNVKKCGEMCSAGFRGASDKGRTIGVTALSAKTARSETLIAEDQARMLKMAHVKDTLAEWMSTLCLRAFQSNRNLALEFSIPSFFDPSWAESPNANVFASNIVCTRDGFNNEAHCDADATSYSYGIFTKIHRTTGEIYWDEKEDYLGDIIGCNFVLDAYHVEICLGSCDGVIESFWASDELHHTSPSTTYDELWTPIRPKDSPITRFGSSVQINLAFLKRIEGLLLLKEGKSEEEWAIYKTKVVKCYNQEVNNKLAKIRRYQSPNPSPHNNETLSEDERIKEDCIALAASSNTITNQPKRNKFRRSYSEIPAFKPPRRLPDGLHAKGFHTTLYNRAGKGKENGSFSHETADDVIQAPTASFLPKHPSSWNI